MFSIDVGNDLRILVLSGVILSVLSFGLSFQYASAELSGVVQIGSLTPLSGDLATYGEENSMAQRIAVNDFNSYLDAKNALWSLELVIEDTQTLPTVALEKIQSLHAKGIKFIVGPDSSGSLQNIKGYVDSNNMVVISCCSTSPLLAIEGDRIFRLAPDDANQAIAITKLLENRGIEVIVPVWRQDAWGEGLKDALHESFPRLGGVVDDGVGYNPEISDFSVETSILADIVQKHVDERGADKVGVVYIAFGEAISFFQSAQHHDVLNDVRWFGTDGNAKDTRLIGDLLVHAFSVNVNFTTTLISSGNNEISNHVETSVHDVIGRNPTSYASSSYDSVWLLGMAIDETQSTDVDTITAVIPGVAKERHGALGSNQLNAAGDLSQANYAISHITDDGWEDIGIYDATTNSIIFDASVMAEEDEDAGAETVPPTQAVEPSSTDRGGGCLIATAAYGSELAPQIQMLREIRDTTLLSTDSGSSFMMWFNQVYYAFSPTIADIEREIPIFKDVVRAVITPGIYALNIMMLADAGSDNSVLTFGIISILSILGIYLVIPYLIVRLVGQKMMPVLRYEYKIRSSKHNGSSSSSSNSPKAYLVK